MRLFLALELPDSLKEEIEKVQNYLKLAKITATWTNPKQFHLTLVFWQDYPEEKLELLITTLKKILINRSSFPLAIGNLEGFPSPHWPRIIILKIKDPTGNLHLLANTIRSALIKEHLYQEEKPFVGHLTLGRIKKRQKAAFTLPKLNLGFSFRAEKITLIKSRLSSSGPIHNILEIFPSRCTHPV